MAPLLAALALWRVGQEERAIHRSAACAKGTSDSAHVVATGMYAMNLRMKSHAALMALLVKRAWPAHLESTAHSTPDLKVGPTARPRTPSRE